MTELGENLVGFSPKSCSVEGLLQKIVPKLLRFTVSFHNYSLFCVLQGIISILYGVIYIYIIYVHGICTIKNHYE